MTIDAATTVYYRCDIILLEHLAGPTTVGYHAAAYRFLDGVVLLATPLGIIWFRKWRMAWQEEDRFWSQIGIMSIIMLSAACGIVLVGSLFSREMVTLPLVTHTLRQQGSCYGSLGPWYFYCPMAF